MRLKTLFKDLIFCGVVILITGLIDWTTAWAQMANGANKFLGNITTNFQVRSDFITYWNQITGENECKWGSVEGTRDMMSWGGADAIANYAKQNNIPWKFHTLIWGAQYPSWMDGLSTADQTAEIIEWFDAAAERYPDVNMIDVVNEGYMSDPNNWNAGKHAPVPFRDALGGTGTTGFDWIVTSFQMARERWPNAILIYNDYNTLEWGNEINWIKDIIPRLVAAGAPIDAVGFQAHGLKGTSAATLQSRFDEIYNAIKLPMLISEYDIGETNDQAQLDNYMAHIPVMWNHPGVVGITMWGYIYGSTWVEGTGLIKDGQERPAMTWLKEFIMENPNPPNDYPNFLNGGGSPSYVLTVSTTGQGTVTRSPNSSKYEEGTVVTLTAEPDEGWEFNSWSGDGISGSENPVTVSMYSDKTVSVLFVRSTVNGNLVLNGDFSSGVTEWTLNVWDGDASGGVQSGEYVITINSVGTENYQIQLVQPGLFLENGKTYEVSFDAYASSDRELEVNVEMAEDPWTSYLPELKYFNLTTTKQTFSFVFTMENSTDVNGRLGFNAGASTEDVYIDNVSVGEYSTSVVSPNRLSQSPGMKVLYSNSAVMVEFTALQNSRADIKLYNLRGKLVKAASVNAGSDGVVSHIFDLGNVSSGVYIVKAYNRGQLLGVSKSIALGK